MSSINVPISDEHLEELWQRAAELKVSPEELVRASVEELLARPDDAFERVAAYVLKKNQELYHRLK